jgi:hypothetical protein
MTTNEQQLMWRSAQSFVADPHIVEIFSRLEQKYKESWASSLPEDKNTRDDAYNMVRAVTAIRDELTALAAEPTFLQFNNRLKRAK